MNLPEKANLEKIYGENSACAARFQSLADNFTRIYKHDHADFFTSLEEQRSSETMLTTTAAR